MRVRLLPVEMRDELVRVLKRLDKLALNVRSRLLEAEDVLPLGEKATPKSRRFRGPGVPYGEVRILGDVGQERSGS